MDEWLIRRLSPREYYDLLKLVEARCAHGATIFCTQYDTNEWYERITPNAEEASPISDIIMGRIIYNAYDILILIDSGVSMRERHGLRNIGA